MPKHETRVMHTTHSAQLHTAVLTCERFKADVFSPCLISALLTIMYCLHIIIIIIIIIIKLPNQAIFCLHRMPRKCSSAC
jgi:lipopolysaccharide/colanic/teichoic acid biosynthesis glycosyltransferase